MIRDDRSKFVSLCDALDELVRNHSNFRSYANTLSGGGNGTKPRRFVPSTSTPQGEEEDDALDLFLATSDHVLDSGTVDGTASARLLYSSLNKSVRRCSRRHRGRRKIKDRGVRTLPMQKPCPSRKKPKEALTTGVLENDFIRTLLESSKRDRIRQSKDASCLTPSKMLKDSEDVAKRTEEIDNSTLESLRRKYEQASLVSLPQAHVRVSDTIERCKADLPLYFLREKNLLSSQMRRACALMESSLRKCIHLKEHYALQRWNVFVERMRRVAKVRASMRLQRTARRFVARHRVERRRIKIHIACKLSRAVLAMAELRTLRIRRARIVRIQGRWRGFMGTRMLRALRRQRNAVTRIQAFWRMCRDFREGARLAVRRRERTLAATKISAFVRGRMSARRTRRRRRLLENMRRKMESSNPRFVRSQRRLRHGATLCIQRCWIRHVRKIRLKDAKRHIMASRIARAYRKYREQTAFGRFLKVAKESAALRSAATRIQNVFRVRRARRRFRQLLADRERLRLARIQEKERTKTEKRDNVDTVGSKAHTSLSRNVFTKLLARGRGRSDAGRQSRIRATSRIQAAWRRRVKRRKVLEIARFRARQDHLLQCLAATKLQSAWRRVARRRRVDLARRNKAASCIQSRLRAHQHRRQARTSYVAKRSAAVRIQTFVRRNRDALQRRRYALLIRRMQARVRAWQAKRRVRNVVVRERVAEWAMRGFAETRIAYRDRLLLLSTVGSVSDPGPVQLIFKTWCNKRGKRLNQQGGSGKTSAVGMERTYWVKMIKSTPKILASSDAKPSTAKKRKKKRKKNATAVMTTAAIPLDTSDVTANAELRALSTTDIDLVFEKYRRKRSRYANYREFVDMLNAVASRRYDDVRQLRYVKSAEHARLLTVLWQLVKAKWAKSVRTFLEEFTNANIRRGATTIQRAYRRLRTKRKIKCWMREYEKAALEGKKLRAVLRIQSQFRRREARKRVEIFAKSVVKKYVEASSQRPYWVLGGTRPTWTKPRCLGDSDVPAVTIASADRSLASRCAICAERVATVACASCATPGEYLCGSCFDTYHVEHTYNEIALCCECELQFASRSCHECEDQFCDTCYRTIHHRSALARHKWTPMIQMCISCNEFAAKGIAHTSSGHSVWTCSTCRGNAWTKSPVLPAFRADRKSVDTRATQKRTTKATATQESVSSSGTLDLGPSSSWEVCVDEASGLEYYYDRISRRSSWTKPGVLL